MVVGWVDWTKNGQIAGLIDGWVGLIDGWVGLIDG